MTPREGQVWRAGDTVWLVLRSELRTDVTYHLIVWLSIANSSVREGISSHFIYESDNPWERRPGYVRVT